MKIQTPLGKRLLLIAGIFSLSIGIIGIFLPLLPTTPFLLLAASCFIRSSNRFYDWLINHRILGRYIRNYREEKAMTVGGKAFILVFLWATIGTTTIFFVDVLLLRLLLLGIACGVTVHILLLRSLRRNPPRQT